MNELKKLLAEATSLPWFVSNTRSPADVYAHVVSEDMYIADCEWDPKFGPADAALIVAAVNALPELLAKVKRYEETLQFIAREQSAATATEAADKFQAIARAALKETGQ